MAVDMGSFYGPDGKINFGRLAEQSRIDQPTAAASTLNPPIRVQGTSQPIPVVNPNSRTPALSPPEVPKGFFGLPEWVVPVAAGVAFLAIYIKIAKRKR